MSFEMNDLSAAEETPNAETGPAKLGDVAGRGTLQVVRGQRGEVTDVTGTWHLEIGKAGSDLDALEAAYEQGTPVVYAGRLDDPADPERTEVELNVLISSIGHYTMDAPQNEENRKEPQDDSPVPELRFFNFQPQDDWVDTVHHDDLPQDPE